MILDSIKVIQERTSHIKCGDDFLLSPDNMFLLDGVCMKLIFIGESIKNIDKKTQGRLFCNYPEVPWKDVMKQRDLIAHHYFRIDSDSIYSIDNMVVEWAIRSITIQRKKSLFF